MSTTNPLSVGEVLDKLRSADPPRSKLAQLDENLDRLRRETQRMQAARRKLEQHQAADVDFSSDNA